MASEGSTKFQERMKKMGLSENEISLYECKFTEGAAPGTLYATKNHLCMYSSVGRKQAITWEDVLQIEKRKVGLLLNGIEVTLNNSSKITIVIASGRDDCYSALTGIWNIYNKAKQIVSEKAKSDSARASIDKSQHADSTKTQEIEKTADKSDKKSKRSSVIIEPQTLETTKTVTKTEVKAETKPPKTPKDAVSGDIHLKIWYQPTQTEDKKIVGTLFVQVIAGRNLIPKDKNGKSDPFCEVNLYKRTKKTKVIKENLNPQWNELFEFNVRKISRQSILEVVVWDEDKITNDFMGVFRVDVSPAYNKPKTSTEEGCVIEDWYVLLTKKEYESTKVKSLESLDLGSGERSQEVISRRSSVSSATSTSVMSPAFLEYSSGAPSTTEDDTSASDRDASKKDKKTKRRTLTKNDVEELKKKEEELKIAQEKQKGLAALLDLPQAQVVSEMKAENKAEVAVETVVVKQETHKPAVEAPKPIVEAPKPVVEAPKPVVEAPKPVVEAPKAVTETKPIVEAPKPTIEAPKVEKAPEVKPIVETKPIVEAPKQEPKKPEQKPLETPKSIVESSKVEPKQETKVEKVKIDEPPKVEAPKVQPKIETHKIEKIETPKEVKTIEPLKQAPKPPPSEKAPETVKPEPKKEEPQKDLKLSAEKTEEKKTPVVVEPSQAKPVEKVESAIVPQGKREILYQDSEKEGDVEQLEHTSLDEIFRNTLISTTEQYPQLFNFLYLVITLQRTKESAIFGALYFALLTFAAWSNFTVVACFMLFLNSCFWIWFFADHVELRLPWDSLLSDPKDKVSPKEIVDFVLLLRRLSIVAVVSVWNRFFSQKASLAAAGVCLLISILGFYVNGYLLTYGVGGVFLALLHHISKHQKSWEQLCESVEKKRV